MIVVVGQPAVDERGALHGNAALIAAAAVQAGARVELVGSVSAADAGEAAALALGMAGVGHAALLRDPAGVGHLDANDLELGLRYLPECDVLVVAEPLAPDTLAVVVAAAAYHAARLVVVIGAHDQPPAAVSDTATVLRAPVEEEWAFAAVVGRYAALLADGQPAAAAWRSALAGSGWQEATGEDVDRGAAAEDAATAEGGATVEGGAIEA